MKISDRRAIPRKDLSLTALGLGSAPMGGLYSPTSFAEAQATTEAAWDQGIRYFDTAPYYGSLLRLHAVRAPPRRFAVRP
jgi:D-threo-aldose 1-dehydrogenase